MGLKKLTPLEILQRKKCRLQMKTDDLIGSLEGNYEYLQQNFFPLLSESAASAVMSKLSPAILDIVPFFMKGKMGRFAGLLIKLLRNTLFKY